ncbi:Uncharacterised protein [Kingella potus]|uniref:Uncharacterized protein n=1 Tax=Kingella potus TaxID=265175 RepID=A0A377R0U1_9NEIS|nr:hypothetical protein [Kingella potus]UOP01749.1 hypothetical protein LVJ84_06450 [Kingella potus]STQ99941.1 Uncharacterised protein [Kingella potus]
MYYYFNTEKLEFAEYDADDLILYFIKECERGGCYGPVYWHDDETGFIMRLNEAGNDEPLYNRPFTKADAKIILLGIAEFYIEQKNLPVFRHYMEAVDYALEYMRDLLLNK